MSIVSGEQKLHAFRHGGAGTLSWVVDENCVLVSINSNVGFVVSDDPSMTTNLWYTTGPIGQQSDNFYFSNDTGRIQLTDLLFELQAQSQVYCHAIAPGVVQLIMVK